MSRYAGVLREAALYFLYLATIASIFVVQFAMFMLHMFAWTRWHIGAWALATGIPIFGGAPVYIHLVNVMLWSWPAVVPSRWILSIGMKSLVSWRKILLAYGVGSLLVCVVALLADTFTVVSVSTWQWLGLLIVATLGYGFTRMVIWRDRWASAPVPMELATS